jgi:hypothetical protein
MIADPEGPSFITRTVGRRQYTDDASVSHDPDEKSLPSAIPSSFCESSVVTMKGQPCPRAAQPRHRDARPVPPGLVRARSKWSLTGRGSRRLHVGRRSAQYHAIPRTDLEGSARPRF